MPRTANCLHVFTESVIRGMTRLANRHGAINLSQGFPDFDPPEELLAALEKAARGPCHQYAVTWGAPNFRQALARKIQKFSGVDIDPDQHLVVTCGSTEAMMVAMMTACNPGDRVVVFSPFYENYAADAILSEYRVAPDTLKTDIRKGCLLYFVGALALVAVGLTGLYFLISKR